MRGIVPYTRREGTSLFPQRDTESNLNEQALARFSPPLARLLHLAHTLCASLYFQKFLLFIKPNTNLLKFNPLFWYSFP